MRNLGKPMKKHPEEYNYSSCLQGWFVGKSSHPGFEALIPGSQNKFNGLRLPLHEKQGNGTSVFFYSLVLSCNTYLPSTSAVLAAWSKEQSRYAEASFLPVIGRRD